MAALHLSSLLESEFAVVVLVNGIETKLGYNRREYSPACLIFYLVCKNFLACADPGVCVRICTYASVVTLDKYNYG